MNNNFLISLTKPLLIPSLYFEFYERLPIPIMIGLLFCTIGDILLLWKKKTKLFFQLGIISFLINHFMYIYCFYGNDIYIVTIIMIILAQCIASHKITNKMDDILTKRFIQIYIFVIGITLYMILIYNNFMITIGYVSFVISDILLGYDIDNSIKRNNIYNVVIMSLYLIGQYLIICNI